jgi:hypothetical protein
LVGATFACLCAVGFAVILGTGASSAGADTACPNEAIRVAQHATQTGDCRAWERVSPADKGGGDIIAEEQEFAAADDGEAAAFSSRYGFADTVGSGTVGRTYYIARRGAGGWSTHSITPQSRPNARQIIGPGTHTEVFSADLSHVLAYGYDLPAATGDVTERMNMYLEDTATRALRPITSSQRGNGEDPIQYGPIEFGGGNELWGASEDLSHVTLESRVQFLPTGAAPGYPQGKPAQPSILFPYAYTYPNVYTWDDGTLHLAGILPDGTAAPEGSSVGPNGPFVRGTMSADGSRQIFFAAPTEGAQRQLYLRIDHNRTDLVSESENPAFTEEPRNIFFEGMTPDGRNVFFATDSPLLEADPNEGSPDLYRWTEGPDPAHEDNLTLITNDGGAVNASGFGGTLVGMSDDGTRVYVTEIGTLLGLWEEDSGIRAFDEVPRPITARDWITLLADNPGKGRVSPDGNWVAYVTDGGVMHLYDRQRDTVTRVASDATLVPTITHGGGATPAGFRPRYLSDGGKVFFTSREALMPQDSNGVADVYSYDGPTGKLSLVTSGSGSQPMEFADASVSGDDVFFFTRAQLVPSDHDEFADLYDARVGGGFDEPQPSPATACVGEGCQAAGGAAAAAPQLASRVHTRGNLKARHRCGRVQRAVRRHGKVRCVKRHHKHGHHGQHKRQARSNRGGGK